MKKYLWLVSLTLSCLFTAYMLIQPPEAIRLRQTGGERKIRDFLGREVWLPVKAPQRIISLSPSNTEILYAIQAAAALTAVTEYSDYPPEAQSKPRIGSYHSPDVERIIALQPDVVLSGGNFHYRTIQQLEQAGIPVVAVEPGTMQEVLEAIRLIGDVAGRSGEAERVVAALTGKMTGIHQLIRREPAKTVFVEVWDEPFMTIGGKSYLSDIISQAGGLNVTRNKPYDYMACDFEMLYGFNPDIYIAVSHGGLGRKLRMSRHPWVQRLNAIQEQRMYYISDDILSRPGPRSFDGLEELAFILHPDLMKDWKRK
ncbi:ABC transporter substrate-binding protein [Acetonema longum]|uniref:Periplasmic binding protein n=1 Tax=Acetonema longum DSM 6540 TaxID=1009370 RepID=F7NPU7_9FIRM|nr:helical backbone metal receptor [Acetonema longum]EGO61938.1 periplasmic binding protein [Acetonema longum DSM 6540]